MFQIKVDNNSFDKGFLYYYLSSNDVKQQLMGGQSSSTMPAITFGMLKNVMVPVFDELSQKKISTFLDDISKKISLNDKVNDNLAA